MIKKLKTYDSDNLQIGGKMSRLAEKIVSPFLERKNITEYGTNCIRHQ